MDSLRTPQYVVLEQRIDAGHDWDGTTPDTTPDFATSGIKVFPSDTHGGRFEYNYNSTFLTEIQQIAVDFNGCATKSIVIRRLGGPDIDVFKSTDPLESNVLITDKFQLAADEYIAIVSTGAATAMYARITARPLHPAPATMLSP